MHLHPAVVSYPPTHCPLFSFLANTTSSGGRTAKPITREEESAPVIQDSNVFSLLEDDE